VLGLDLSESSFVASSTGRLTAQLNITMKATKKFNPLDTTIVLNCHQQKQPLLLVVLFLSQVLLFGCWSSLSGSIASSTSEIFPSESCQRKLDALDAFSNARRAARWEIVQKTKAASSERNDAIFDLFEPEAVCLTEERFGGERFFAFGDGPKFVCAVDYLRESYKNRNDTCLVYSVGSYNDVTFEKAVKEYIGCEIHTFDPTLQDPFVGDAYATFHPWGVGAEGEQVYFGGLNVTFVTQSVESIVNQLGHQGRKIDIFKIDCEGCEFDSMPPLFEAIAHGTLQIDQLLIEIHAFVSPNKIEDLFAKADEAGFRIFHKERNGWGCQGKSCVEYAFVNQNFLRNATAAAMC
jgi:hypothetical protein